MDVSNIKMMRKYGISILRVVLGIVFLWFGLLKIFGVSPVTDLIKNTYTFMPQQTFIMVLGIWESIIGLGLIFKTVLRFTLALLWLQMLGTFASVIFSPAIFFSHGNPFLLTTYGEFLVKNIVLVAAGIVIGGYEVEPRRK